MRYCYNLEAMQSLAGQLALIRQSIEEQKASVAEFAVDAGNRRVEQKLNEFAGNWSDARARLVSNLEATEAYVRQVAEVISKGDVTIAASLVAPAQ